MTFFHEIKCNGITSFIEFMFTPFKLNKIRGEIRLIECLGVEMPNKQEGNNRLQMARTMIHCKTAKMRLVMLKSAWKTFYKAMNRLYISC